jgi:hypothetical protein
MTLRRMPWLVGIAVAMAVVGTILVIVAFFIHQAHIKGWVVGKIYDPPYTTYVYNPVYTYECTGSGKSQDCEDVQTGLQGSWQYHPAQWILVVRGGPDSGDVYVDADTYATTKEGSWWGAGSPTPSAG